MPASCAPVAALLPQAATVQPALLAQALRRAALDAGVRIAEHSRVRRLTSLSGGTARIEVDGGGRVTAGTAVLAINAATALLCELPSRFRLHFGR